MHAARILVLVADRNRLVAEALVAAFIEVAEVDARIATSLAQALLMAQSMQPNLVLVDAWIAGTDVESAVRQLKECAPSAGLFVMASRVDGEFERRALAAGATACYVNESVPLAATTMLGTLVTGS